MCVYVHRKGKMEEIYLMVCLFTNVFRLQSFFECKSVLSELF